MTNTQGPTATIEFDDRTPRLFMLASIIWGLVGMLVGVLVAAQLNWHWLNFDLPWTTFGRLRPLHTNAVIFAFVGNMMFAGVYHSTQRLCKCRTASDLLSKIHFWGWQLIILAAALTLPFGLTRSKEYAELIWPINIAVALIWVVFGVNFFWTLIKRNEPSLYVALWFYIATIITVTMLYIVNHLQIPTSLTHSYPVFGGVQDALVQWWYGHNAVAFFLTTPILGIMYYYLPKAANRPVYSYRLSIVHFWSLVFIYIWAGPHHLLNTALPKWLQLLGMFFSLMLWAPSWGGMLNGLLTLRGAWNRLRTDPVIKFFVVGVTFYGMATFEGPLLSIRAVNSLSHYSDWTIGHVHSGTLGWNGFMAAGMFYWLAPRLWRRKDKNGNDIPPDDENTSCNGLFSISAANMHFWLGLVGILLYVGSMWIAGITQGLALNATTEDGTMLRYPDFVETSMAIRPLMATRVVGGVLYLAGFFILAWNIFMTAAKGRATNESREVVLLKKEKNKETDPDSMTLGETFKNDPVTLTLSGLICLCLWFFLPPLGDTVALLCTIGFAILAVIRFQQHGANWSRWYERLLENWMPFTILTFVAVAIGGFIQILPTVTVNRAKNIEGRLQELYTPLELAGRDIYVSEGCYNCHSQMIRTMVPDVLRYGPAPDQGYSRIGESIYDHPFQWGSRRTGPDLAREGGVRPNSWHYQHMMNPRSTSGNSNMPSYPWLADKKVDLKALPKKIAVLQRLGVPFPAMTRDEIQQSALEQGMTIRQDLETSGAYVAEDSQMVAIIAYLQKLGSFVDTTAEPEEEMPPPIPSQPRGPIEPAIPDNTRDNATTAQR
ncbi:MAG: cytochrome-c oxidase, cbb3-type subunit I [Verrucomicrobiota bacterium]